MIATLLCLSLVEMAADDIDPPVTFEFKRMSGPAKGRKEAFDPKTQVYHLHIHDIARFEVKAVTADLEKRRVVLQITGMLDRPEGPLVLNLPQKDGKNREVKLGHQEFDKELFRIERRDGITSIEFLPKGKALLKPGTWFQYIDFYRN